MIWFFLTYFKDLENLKTKICINKIFKITYEWMNEWRFFKIKEKLEAGVHIVNK